MQIQTRPTMESEGESLTPRLSSSTGWSSAWAQDETVFIKTDVTKGQRVAHTYRIKIGPGRPVGRKRIVMPVEHDDGMRSKYRPHGEGLGRGDADGEKALPIATNDSAAGEALPARQPEAE